MKVLVAASPKFTGGALGANQCFIVILGRELNAHISGEWDNRVR